MNWFPKILILTIGNIYLYITYIYTLVLSFGQRQTDGLTNQHDHTYRAAIASKKSHYINIHHNCYIDIILGKLKYHLNNIFKNVQHTQSITLIISYMQNDALCLVLNINTVRMMLCVQRGPMTIGPMPSRQLNPIHRQE